MQSGRVYYCYLAFGELSIRLYCLLQKITLTNGFPVIRKWEAYLLPNRSCFAALDEDQFLEATRLSIGLEKLNSSFLQKEFRKDFRQSLEESVSTKLSTIATRSLVGRGLSCFCPENIITGDNNSAFFLFGQLLDGLLRLATGGEECRHNTCLTSNVF